MSGNEPELNAVDLPILNPDMVSLRKTVGLYRGHLHDILLQKYGIELLGIYAYPAQVIYCKERFDTLKDLAGRKVRTSSVGQSEMMSALGAVPIVTPFSEIISAIKTGVADCAITGTMSGSEIGLPNVTSYISPMAISWGLSFFGANRLAWDQLPADIREALRDGIGGLERAIWTAADRETEAGLACNIGSDACASDKIFHMKVVSLTPDDDLFRRKLLTTSILPKWIQRCGRDSRCGLERDAGPSLGDTRCVRARRRGLAGRGQRHDRSHPRDRCQQPSPIVVAVKGMELLRSSALAHCAQHEGTLPRLDTPSSSKARFRLLEWSGSAPACS